MSAVSRCPAVHLLVLGDLWLDPPNLHRTDCYVSAIARAICHPTSLPNGLYARHIWFDSSTAFRKKQVTFLDWEALGSSRICRKHAFCTFRDQGCVIRNMAGYGTACLACLYKLRTGSGRCDSTTGECARRCRATVSRRHANAIGRVAGPRCKAQKSSVPTTIAMQNVR